MKKYRLKRKGFDDTMGVYDSKQDAAHALWNKTIELNDEGITPFDFECEEFDEISVEDIDDISVAMEYLGDETKEMYVHEDNAEYLDDLDDLILLLRAWNKIDGYHNGGISIQLHMIDEDRKREFVTMFGDLWESVRFLKA